MMKTILLATDCTKNSSPFLRYVYRLCNALKSNLSVLHVYDIPPIANTIFRTPEKLKRFTHLEKQEILDKYCSEHLKGEGGKSPIKTVVTYNESISEAILSKSMELHVEMMIVGMKDEHTQRGFFSGNIANALLKNIGCPLLILPHDIQYKKLNTVVYATDFEENDIFAIKKLVDLAKPFGATINVVHIAIKDESSGDEQMEWFKEMLYQHLSYQKINFKLIQADRVDEGLRIFVENENADLIALLEREDRSFFGKLFHKNTLIKMESQIKIPLLSINRKSLS